MMRAYNVKASNFDWFGNIPAHWKIKKLTQLTTFTTGFTPSTGSPEFYGGEYNWVTIDDMNDGIISSTKNTLSELGIIKRKKKLALPGSLLYSFKLTVGKTAYVKKETYTNEAIAAFRPNPKINMTFFKYSISDYLINYAKHNIYNAPLLNSGLIKGSRILTPPIDEQKEIADYLDKACEKINKTKKNIGKQIKILIQYRQSLIHECVTGKKRIYEGETN